MPPEPPTEKGYAVMPAYPCSPAQSSLPQRDVMLCSDASLGKLMSALHDITPDMMLHTAKLHIRHCVESWLQMILDQSLSCEI